MQPVLALGCLIYDAGQLVATGACCAAAARLLLVSIITAPWLVSCESPTASRLGLWATDVVCERKKIEIMGGLPPLWPCCSSASARVIHDRSTTNALILL